LLRDEGFAVDGVQRLFIAIAVIGVVGFVVTLGWLMLFD
jgi:preprotein translocase subunit Sss1